MPAGDTSNEDSWTQVTRGKNSARAEKVAVTIKGVPAEDSDATVASLTAEFQKAMDTWQHSACRAKALEILSTLQRRDELHITTALIVASGSFSRIQLERRRTSLLQLACFTDVTRHLQALCQTNIQLVAQDPIFTSLDQDFLQSLGFIVLPYTISDMGTAEGAFGPAKDHLGPNTFMFEAFIDMGMECAEAFACSGMGVLIGSPMDWRADTKLYPLDIAAVKYAGMPGAARKYRNWAEIVEAFRHNYRSVKFPDFEEHPNALWNLQIFTADPTDGDE